MNPQRYGLPNRAPAGKPGAVTMAVLLLYGGIGIAVVRAYLEISRMAHLGKTGLAIGIAAPSLGLVYLVIRKIGEGHNWARMVYAALFFLGIPVTVRLLPALPIPLNLPNGMAAA